MATTATFSAGPGLLTEFGDTANNSIVTSRNGAGRILVNNGAVPITGGTPTVANTNLIEAFGQDGNDTIALDETNGALSPTTRHYSDGFSPARSVAQYFRKRENQSPPCGAEPGGNAPK